jgi:hypothetical protein
MCFTGRRLVMAVHLIDSEPVALLGVVQSCEYEGEGLCNVAVEFLPMLDRAEIRDWVRERGR